MDMIATAQHRGKRPGTGYVRQEIVEVLAQEPSDVMAGRLAREVVQLRRRLQVVLTEQRRAGLVGQACLSALREPGTVRDVAQRLGWSYRRARAWVHQLLRTGAIRRVDTVRTASGQQAGRYVVTS